MKSDIIKSKKVPAEERTTVGLSFTNEMIELEPTEDGSPRFRRGERDECLRIVQQMDGPLQGLEVVVRIDLTEGNLMVRDMTFTPTEPMPLHGVGTAAMRELRFGEIEWIVERVLSQMVARDELLAESVMPYLLALNKHKRRPGRRGISDLRWANIAAKRVEAEGRWPGNAMRNMCNEWPELFSSAADASDKVYRAKRKGMIDTERGRSPRLTEKAIRTLGAGSMERSEQ